MPIFCTWQGGQQKDAMLWCGRPGCTSSMAVKLRGRDARTTIANPMPPQKAAVLHAEALFQCITDAGQPRYEALLLCTDTDPEIVVHAVAVAGKDEHALRGS